MDVEVLDRALRDPAFTRLAPDEFGPPIWKALHNLARCTNDCPIKLQAFQDMCKQLQVLLPCAKCANHFSKLVSKLDPATTRDVLQWTIDTHNAVNARLGKTVLDYESAIRHIRQKRTCLTEIAAVPSAALCGTWSWTAASTVLVIVVGGLFIAVIALVFALVAQRRHWKRTSVA